MARLIYTAIASLDGYVADEGGNFDWAAPDEEVHRFVNEQERHIGTHLYGRRLYEVMSVWETLPLEEQPKYMRDYALIWRAADKVVYSKTLHAATTARTRIEREFEPAKVREMKATLERDIGIGGPTLAANAIKADLVDDYHLFVTPVVVGGGTSWLPDGVRLDVSLVDEHRFGGGVVHLHYRGG